MTAADPGADTVTQLADALPEALGWVRWDVDHMRRTAAALLPAVDRIARHRAADELDEAADWCHAAAETWARGSSNIAHAGYLARNELRNRAAALRAEP